MALIGMGDILPYPCCEELAKQDCKAFEFSFQCSNLHLWAEALNNQKEDTVDTKEEMYFHGRVAWLSLRESVKSSDIKREFGVEQFRGKSIALKEPS